MWPILGLVARITAVTVAVVGIRYLLRVKPTETPMEHTTEQVSIMAIVACTYGWDNVCDYTGYSVTELMLLCILVIGSGNYVWHYQRVHNNETIPQETQEFVE